jgi:hypothetical protein
VQSWSFPLGRRWILPNVQAGSAAHAAHRPTEVTSWRRHLADLEVAVRIRAKAVEYRTLADGLPFAVSEYAGTLHTVYHAIADALDAVAAAIADEPTTT